jgi:7-keto-8-aminopelargonate synthetase-like enzyme
MSNKFNNWQKRKIEESHLHQEKISALLNGQNFILRNQKKIVLEDEKDYIEFISCGYLGLDQHKSLIEAASKQIEHLGISFPAARARLKYRGFDEFESLLNNIYDANVVYYSSTHLAHLGFIPLLASGVLPGFEIKVRPIFFLDSHVHASIQINRGLMQQFGDVKLLNFLDIDSLRHELEQAQKHMLTPILMTDSVCSMGGIMPIQEFLNLSNQYKAYLYLDDAHGMSVFGKNGCGYVLKELNYNFADRLILVSSLAKGFGTYGGIIAVSNQKAIKFIKSYCSTYIFSGQPVHHLLLASIESAKIHLSSDLNKLQNQLYNNIELFDSLIVKKHRVVNIDTKLPIRGLLIGDEDDAINKGLLLKSYGILTTVAMYPTVPKKQSIIRLSICANHTHEEIKLTCFRLNQIL